VSSEDYKYLIDTNVFVRIWELKDCSKIIDDIINLAVAGRVRTVRQVFGELKKWPLSLDALKPHRSIIEIDAKHEYTDEISDVIEWLGNNTPWLWVQTGAGNPDSADPWLVAIAKTQGFTVVTNEGQRKQKNIPTTCRLPDINCRCITGPHFLFEVNIVKEIRPEWIDPDAFYKGG
jgi:hypothetical protein